MHRVRGLIGMFGRKRRASAPAADEEPVAPSLPRLDDVDPVWGRPGPRSAEEVDSSVGYIDMGSLRVPVVPGMQIRTQTAPDSQAVVRVMLVLGASAVQISLAAAPRSGGVWADIRSEIVEGHRAGGAEVEETNGRYGVELAVRTEAVLPDGSTGRVPLRIVGRDGNRWFARIDVIGPAVTDPRVRSQVEALIDRLVVVRDEKPRARLDLLPITVPTNGVVVDE